MERNRIRLTVRIAYRLLKRAVDKKTTRYEIRTVRRRRGRRHAASIGRQDDSYA